MEAPTLNLLNAFTTTHYFYDVYFFFPRTLRANYQGQSMLLVKVFMLISKTNFKRIFTFQTRINYVMLAVITYSLFFDPKKEYSTSYFSNGQKLYVMCFWIFF